ncbi:solute carrier family 23 member 2-like [Uloborus diversus]|uniref:solute carrier family 23 member 2-like n=1 Tax=Uloborus diversus TaxID=327109 RepID=UPI00240989FE|nr:solute carrier family 23 member 2-like [Uloborus diversus]
MAEDSIEEPGLEKYKTDVIYKLEDVPPWYMSILLAIQHYLTMFSGAIAVPYLLSSNICMKEDSLYKGHLISATFFACGVTTLIQVTIGCRLPIIQGPSLGLLSSALAILSQPKWKCPSEHLLNNMTEDMKNEEWMSRMREIQGAIIVGSVVEVLIGLTGLIGFLMKWITPLSVMPTITLIGLSLFGEAARQASGHWAVSSL